MKLRVKTGVAVVAVCSFYFFANETFGQKCGVDAGFRGSAYSIDRYKNRSLIKGVRNLNQIPMPARGKLIEHLRSKLGKKFFDRLKYDGGEWTDLEALKRESPSDYNRNAPMGAFDLRFTFSDSKKGLKYFYTKLVLDDDGSIREDIGLPDIGVHPEKARIISCRRAIEIAAINGFPKKAMSVSFDYSADADTFVWIVTDSRGTTPDESLLGLVGQGTYKKIVINANNGEVIRVYKETIIV
ncbi:MAG: hypothetical protein JNL64_09830 [Blastocatellia bacterium]|nr:hypothetical protein [Blastocatellia bacterium]